MTIARSILELLASCLFYSLVVILIDVVLILIFFGDLSQVAYFLSLVILVEGGLGLIVGGAISLNTPIISKMGEVFFHSKPWSAKRQKELETKARAWIVTGLILVFAALLVSAVWAV
jgi:hypothetical protein